MAYYVGLDVKLKSTHVFELLMRVPQLFHCGILWLGVN